MFKVTHTRYMTKKIDEKIARSCSISFQFCHLQFFLNLFQTPMVSYYYYHRPSLSASQYVHPYIIKSYGNIEESNLKYCLRNNHVVESGYVLFYVLMTDTSGGFEVQLETASYPLKIQLISSMRSEPQGYSEHHLM